MPGLPRGRRVATNRPGQRAAGVAGDGTAAVMIKLDEITSNNILTCAHCGEPITVDNYSGWEVFVETGKTTQPICKFCNMVMDAGPMEKDDSRRNPRNL